jgi:hypothetical protein
MTPPRIRRIVRALPLALLVLGALLSVGCATLRPWDRDLLAEPQMSFVPSKPEHDVDDHVYFSKEGSSGGQNVGGGGCGCN